MPLDKYTGGESLCFIATIHNSIPPFFRVNRDHRYYVHCCEVKRLLIETLFFIDVVHEERPPFPAGVRRAVGALSL